MGGVRECRAPMNVSARFFAGKCYNWVASLLTTPTRERLLLGSLLRDAWFGFVEQSCLELELFLMTRRLRTFCRPAATDMRTCG
jgi:hypothetical protein